MESNKAINIALYGFCAAVAAFAIWIGLRFALPIFLPFFLAYALSYAIRPAARYISKKTGISDKFFDVLIILLISGGIICFIWFGAAALIREARSALTGFADTLSQANGAFDSMNKFVIEIGERFGSGKEFAEGLKQMISSAAVTISSSITGLATRFIASLPSFLFAVAMAFVSLFYFCLSYDESSAAIHSLIPKKIRSRVRECVSAIMRGLGRFIRAYICIMAVTFAELFAGFLILSVEHAFLWALLISVIDILPVFGVGTVLIPWAAIALLQGNIFRGLGLLILLAVMWGVRQPVEARLVGQSAGVHPVLALISVYAGFRLAGVGGMILAPLALNAWAVMWEERNKKSAGRGAPTGNARHV